MQFRDHTAIIKRGEFFWVDPSKIIIKDGWNHRQDYTGEEELVSSIIQNGVMQNITVEKIGNSEKGFSFILVDGERRLRAVTIANGRGAKIKAIPATIKSNLSQSDALFTQIISNDGKPFLPIEEATAYKQLVDWGHDIKEIAKSVGRDPRVIKQRLNLLGCNKELQKMINKKEIPIGLATNILKKSAGDKELEATLTNEAKQGKVGRRNVKKKVITQKHVKIEIKKLEKIKNDFEDFFGTKVFHSMNSKTICIDFGKYKFCLNLLEQQVPDKILKFMKTVIES